MSRTAKQISYGFFYVLAFGVLAAGIYFLFLRTEPSCTNGIQDGKEQGIDCGETCGRVCIPATLKPLVAGAARVFNPEEGRVSVLVEVTNPNPDWGTDRFDYRFELFTDKGQSLGVVEEQSFIYPGEVKYVFAFVPVEKGIRVQRAAVSAIARNWLPSAEFRKAVVAIESQAAAREGGKIRATGRIVNRDTIPFDTVIMTAILKNSLNIPVGVSATEIGTLEVGGSKPFSVIHPDIPSADLNRTQILAFPQRKAK